MLFIHRKMYKYREHGITVAYHFLQQPEAVLMSKTYFHFLKLLTLPESPVVIIHHTVCEAQIMKMMTAVKCIRPDLFYPIRKHNRLYITS